MKITRDKLKQLIKEELSDYQKMIKQIELNDYIDTFNIPDNTKATTADDLTKYLKGRIEQRPDLKDTIFKHLKAALGYAELGKLEKAEIAAQVIKNLGLDNENN